MIGTITLNPSIDRNLFVKHLAMDDVNRAVSVNMTPGGKGINVSKVVRELGEPTRAHTIAGGVTGRLLIDLMRRIDLRHTVTWVRGMTRINTVITDIVDGTQTRVSDHGPVVNSAELARFRRSLLAVRPRPWLWALGGSQPPGMPSSACRDLIRDLQRDGTPCVLDTDDEALRLGIEAKPFIIKPNEHEISRLVGRRIQGVSAAHQAAMSVVRRGVGIVIVSLGAQGAVFVSEREAFHVPAPRVSVSSKVGAGDSLIGGFVSGLFRGLGFEESAKLGVAASSSAVMREGPRLCHRADIPGLLRRIRLRAL